MNHIHRYIETIIALTVASIMATANAEDAYVYFSWESVYDHQPDTVITNVGVNAPDPFNISIEPMVKSKTSSQILKKQALVVAINDEVWYVNGNLLRKQFDGDLMTDMRDFMPFYFTDKIAYFQYSDMSDSRILVSVMTQLGEDATLVELLSTINNVCFHCEEAYCYILDFNTMKVNCLHHEAATKLFSRYSQLQRRYDAMKYYKYPTMINSYFQDYVGMLDNDDDVPPVRFIDD